MPLELEVIWGYFKIGSGVYLLKGTTEAHRSIYFYHFKRKRNGENIKAIETSQLQSDRAQGTLLVMECGGGRWRTNHEQNIQGNCQGCTFNSWRLARLWDGLPLSSAEVSGQVIMLLCWKGY